MSLKLRLFQVAMSLTTLAGVAAGPVAHAADRRPTPAECKAAADLGTGEGVDAFGRPTMTLLSRYNGVGDYVTATYNFRHKTREDVELTRNNWDILFEARADFADYFDASLVSDDRSRMYDLGAVSCDTVATEDLGAMLKELRAKKATRRPDKQYRDFMAAELVKQDHCYLVDKISPRHGRTVSVFRVLNHKKSTSVTLGEIRVLLDINLEDEDSVMRRAR